ncbi:MAG: tetratricopeptide repeat protein [Rubripirellula sp.]
MSSADEPTAASDVTATGSTGANPGAAETNPMGGGRWRQVRVEALTSKPFDLVKESTEPAKPSDQPKPKLRLERRQELEHHLKESPTDLDAFMELGRIYRTDNRPLDAKRIYQQAIQIFPDEQDLLWEYEEAILSRSLQQLREVSELAQRLDTLETERELKRSQDDWACRRMEVCRARIGRDPSLTHLRVALAESMFDAGMFEGAIEELEQVFDNDELSPTAFLIQGRCLLAMGKDVEAMASLRATALRRSVVAPLRTRIAALRLLCETADRLGVSLTLATYRQHLEQAEQELTKQPDGGS